MADNDTDELLQEDITEGLQKKRLSGKMMVVFAGGALLLMLAGAGAFFILGGEDEGAQQVEANDPNEPKKLVFLDLPEMVVNLNTSGPQTRLLKINVALEVDRASAEEAIEDKMPRVIDQFQVYLRELRLEDLNGSAGMFRLKEELLLRVNQAVAPVQVKDVLFREMVIQ